MQKPFFQPLDALHEDGSRVELEQAIVRLMKPLARLMRETELSAANVYDLYKIAAVKVEADSFKNNGSIISISEISATTGITRGDVSRILKMLASGTREPITKSRQPISRILGAWQNIAKSKNMSERPICLSLYGKGVTFDFLVKNYGAGVPTRAVLDALAKIGMVKVMEGDVICLTDTKLCRVGTDSQMLHLFVERMYCVMDSLVNAAVTKREARFFAGEYRIPMLSSSVRAVAEDLRASGFSVIFGKTTAKRKKISGKNIATENASTQDFLTFFCHERSGKTTVTDSKKKRSNFKRSFKK